MRFVNETDLQADALWGADGETDLGVAVLVKATYELHPGGMTRAAQDPWPVHQTLMETPYGIFPAEQTPYPKPRTDIIVLGFAHPPGGRPVDHMEVKVAVGGGFRYALRVTGDRVWRRQEDQLVPSAPLPFSEMPLTLDRAFGGAATKEWGDLPFPHNPEGRGFYLEEEEAEGSPLPNLEDPRALVREWQDRPDPAAPGLYPMEGGLRSGVGLGPDQPPRPAPDGDHLIHCWAHPDLMMEGTPAPGERVRVDGIHADGPLELHVPRLEAAAAVEHGGQRLALPHKLDTIIVQGEERRVVFRWRFAGTFPLRPREERRVVLEPLEEGEESA